MNGIEIVIRQSRDLGGVRLLPGEPVAYFQGDVGWIADRPRLVLSTGTEAPLRLTAVVAMERGLWRVVQWHNSIGEPDQVLLGRSLTKSIEAIEHSVRRDRPDFRPAAAPDGTVTIAFADIESSSVLLDRLGDAAFVCLL